MVSLKQQNSKIEAQKTAPACWCMRALFATMQGGCSRSEDVRNLSETL